MIPTNLIPIGDTDPPRQRFPLFVLTFLLINIAVFIYQVSLGTDGFAEFVYRYGATPYELTRFTDLPPTIDYPFWVTAFTSMFIHGSILHIGFNMLYLWVFGDNIEDAMGHGRFFIFYFICGLGALAAQVIVDPGSTVPMVGASGAIAGVLGAYLILSPGRTVRVMAIIVIIPLFFRLPAIIVIGFWIIVQIMAGYVSLGPSADEASGGVAYFAHIGGFFTGLLLVWFFRKR